MVQFQQTIPIEQPDFSSFERLRRIHPIDSHNENRNRMASTHGKMKTTLSTTHKIECGLPSKLGKAGVHRPCSLNRLSAIKA